MGVNFEKGFTSDNVQKYKPLSGEIKKGLTVNGATIKENESHATYYANLPEGHTQKSVEELAKYNSKYVTASHVAVGELATEVFLENPSVNQVEAQIGFFGKSDNIEISVSRSKTYQNHLAENDADKEVTKHLVMKTTVTSTSAKGYGVKAVKDSMSEEFQGLFSK